jgi:two-component system, sensor histidine kinase PdtaS
MIADNHIPFLIIQRNMEIRYIYILLYFVMKCIFRFLIFLIPLSLSGQVKELNGTFVYQEVFVETDDFGAEYLDTMEKAVEKITDTDLRLKILNDLGYYYHTRNLKKSLEIIQKGLAEARSQKNSYWEGRLQVSEGAVLLRMEELDFAELTLRSAIEKIPENERWLLYTNLGYVYERRGDLSEAFEIASNNLQMGEKFQDNKAMAMAYSDLCNLFWKQGKYHKGLEYGLKSLELFKKNGIYDLDYDFTFHLIGNNLVMLKRNEEALAYFQSSVKIGEKYGFYNNLSDTYIALAELYKEMENYPNAEISAIEALKYAELLENDFMIMRSLLTIGKLNNHRGKFNLAIENLKKCIQIATPNFGDKFYLSLAYEEISKAYEGIQNPKESLAAYKMYKKLHDEVFNSEADQRFALLQTQMDITQKETTISLQEAKLDQQTTIQLFILILTGFLLIFLSVLYRFFIRKKKYSEVLEKQNEEKEFLLKEIHHRVKNNLEIISSLLALQSEQIDDDNIKLIMMESQNRVQSMGMIHQNLYVGENIASIEMKKYFQNLSSYILESFGAAPRVKVRCEMEALELDIDRAIPIGLIVNELLTNALKYAFPENRNGLIKIRLEEKNDQLQLKIEDNGVGYTENPKIMGTGFGTQLVNLLCRQLDGKMKLISDRGTSVFFQFQNNHAA